MKPKILAIDLGTVRIGTAISDGLGLCANPLVLIQSRGDEEDARALVKLGEEHEAAEFLVGLPLNMDGSDGPAAQHARAFADRLRALSGKPVILWDERLSSVEALEILSRGATRRKKRKQSVDMAAATVFLQGYLDSNP